MTPNDATNVLLTFTPDTPRDLVAWAIGAEFEAHALSVVQMVDGTFHADAMGSTLSAPSMRWLDSSSREVWISPIGSRDREERLITVTWREIARVLDVAPELYAEMRAVLAERRELTGAYDAAPWRGRWRLTDEEAAARDAYSKGVGCVEDRCYVLGAEAWNRCRPADVHEPADLLELLDAMTAVA